MVTGYMLLQVVTLFEDNTVQFLDVDLNIDNNPATHMDIFGAVWRNSLDIFDELHTAGERVK